MFQNDTKKFYNMVESNFTSRFRRVSLKALEMVIRETPVDTGCARANWNVKEGTPDESFNSLITDKTGGKTIAKGMTTTSGAKPDKTLFLTNATPYIMILEQGYSKQALGGIVSPTIVVVKSLIDRGLL